MSFLTEPMAVRSLVLHSRLVMPPLATEKSEDGAVGQGLLSYYDEKTKGGWFGLVIVEHSYVSLEGRASRGQVSFARDEDVAGLSCLTDVIHANGCPVFAQINHAGGKGIAGIEDVPTVPAPTAMDYTTTRGEAVRAHTMTQAEIDAIVDTFAQAARRAMEAGFDGVEIHSAHGYLLDQFYSPLTNRRTDAYTGSTIEGRTRIHLEVIEAVRALVGPDYPVALRLGANDYSSGGATAEDAAAACQLFVKAGIDIIDVSGGLCGYRGLGTKEEGYFRADSATIRAAVNVPVILTGGVRTYAGAERLIAEGDADLIGVGRPVLKDSDFAPRLLSEAGALPCRGTVFFDYDGTLHNSMAIYGPAFRTAYAWLVAQGAMPEREFTDEWISQWLGYVTEEMWTTFAPELPEQTWRHAADIVADEMERLTEEGKAELFAGVPEMLEDLKARGYRLAFLSNCRTRYCQVHRAMFGLDRWFDAYYCAEDFDDIPKWEIYQRVVHFHARPQAMVGDRFHDLEVAIQGGIPSIGCTYGFWRSDELSSATVLVDTPQAIVGAVECVFARDRSRVGGSTTQRGQ